METQKSQNPSPAMNAAMSSCRKKKTEGASFVQDLRDHLDEFVHASMDEHKTCFKKTIQKMFGMAKIIEERTKATGEVESSLPLKTTVSQRLVS